MASVMGNGLERCSRTFFNVLGQCFLLIVQKSSSYLSMPTCPIF